MEAIFVQLEEKKSGVKVTAWLQDFDYSESCHHVYVTKRVFRNGSKSTLPAFAKASGKTVEDIPTILTANTYFWSPAGDSRSRRGNENRRMDEIWEFMINNKDQVTNELNTRFSEFLSEDEVIMIDEQGAYLISNRGRYYFYEMPINKEAIEYARVRIQEKELAS
jgi:arsenate reductase-like glutaredoxin family protein